MTNYKRMWMFLEEEIEEEAEERDFVLPSFVMLQSFD